MSESDNKYNHSSKGRARYARYRQSINGRAMISRYTRSKAHKECRRRYMSKPEVREHYNWLAKRQRSKQKIKSMSI